jgi:hypothetical protein
MDMIQKDDAWFEYVTYNGSSITLVKAFDSIDQVSQYGELIVDGNGNYRVLAPGDFAIIRKEDHYEITVPDGFALIFEKASCGLPQKILGNTDLTYYGETIKEDEILVGPAKLVKTQFEIKRSVFQGGYFQTPQSLLQTIQDNNIMTLSQDTTTGLFVVKLVNDDMVLRFSEHVSNILGFRRQSIQEKEVYARHSLDRFPGMNCVLVSTNFIEESYVGDTRVPLLRTLPIRFETQQHHTMSYECFPIQYKKVLQKELDSIRILLVDDTGRKLPFTDRGRVSLTIHFRRRYGALPSR